MADLGRWFKLWCDSPDDEALDNLDIADFGRWAKLGCHVKRHGTGGRVTLEAPSRTLCAKFQVPDFATLLESISRLPNVEIQPQESRDETADRVTANVTVAIVTFLHWQRYQGDWSGGRVEKFRKMKRSSVTVKEEKRRDPPIVPQPTKKLKPVPKPCDHCSAILAHLNNVTGRQYRLVGKGAQNLHRAHQEVSTDKCLRVIDFKWEQWRSDPKMSLHVDLLTLFRPSNFDRYLNQAAAISAVMGPRRYLEGDYE